MDIEEDDEGQSRMSPEKESSLHTESEAEANKEDKHLRKIVHSKSLDDLSPEEDRAKKYQSSSQVKSTAGSGGQLTSSESFNNFLYWRDPLPVLDDLDDLKTTDGTEAAATSEMEAASEKSSAVNETGVEASAAAMDNAVSEKKDA